MDANQLRELGNQCHAAADHLQASQSRGATAQAGAFNWQSLITLISQVLPAILALFGSGKTPTPAPAPGPTPPRP